MQSQQKDLFKASNILIKGIVIFALLSIGLIIGYVATLKITNNFHTVEPSQIYRSAQMDEKEFLSTIHKYGIKSIINLRGPSNSSWYKDEILSLRHTAVKHYDFALSADQEVSLDKEQDLISLLAAVPKPVLIHCRSGSDRTGLASALYMLAIKHRPYKEAKKQLSILYGHFPWLGSQSKAMDISFEAFALSRGLLVTEQAE